MTEEVIIGGIVGGVPEWATEKSLQQLITDMKAMGSNSQSVANAIKELAKAMEQKGENSPEAAQALQRVSKELEDLAPKLDASGAPDPGKSKFGKGLEKLGSTMSDTTKEVFEDFNRNLMSSSYRLGAFGIPLRKAQGGLMDLSGKAGKLGKVGFMGLAGTIGLATSAIGAMIRVITDAASTLKSMNDVGLIEIRNAAQLNRVMGDLGMTSDQLTRLTQEYARELGTFGFDSLQNFVSGSKETEQSMYNLGLTLADASEFGAQYLKLQRLGGTFQSMRNVEERENFVDTMQNLTAFSRILNVSRSEIMKVAAEIMENEFVRARIAGIQDRILRKEATDSMKNMSMMFASLGPQGKKLGDLFAQGVGALDPMLIEDFQNMLPFAGEAAMEMMDMARRVASGEEISVEDSVASLLRLEEALEKQSSTISHYAALQDPQAAELMATLQTMREARSRYENDERSQTMSRLQYIVRERELAQRLVQSGAQLQTVFTQLRIRFQEALMRILQVFTGKEGAADIAEVLGDSLDVVENWLKRFVTVLEGVVDETGGLPAVLSEGLGRAIQIILRSLGDQLVKSENRLVRGLGYGLGGARSPEERAIREIEDQLPTMRGGSYWGISDHLPAGMSQDEYLRLRQRQDLLQSSWQRFESPEVQAVLADMGTIQSSRITTAREETINASDPMAAFVGRIEASMATLSEDLKELTNTKDPELLEKRKTEITALQDQVVLLDRLLRELKKKE